MVSDDGRHRIRTPLPRSRTPAVPEEILDDVTPPPSGDPTDALDRIGRNVRLTAKQAQATVDRVDGLRHEMGSRLTRVEARIDQVADDVAHGREVGARNEGKLDTLIDVLDAERKSRAQYEAAAAAALTASTEVTRSRALSMIESEASDRAAQRTERAESHRHWRAIALRILAGVATVWAAVSAYLLAR